MKNGVVVPRSSDNFAAETDHVVDAFLVFLCQKPIPADKRKSKNRFSKRTIKHSHVIVFSYTSVAQKLLSSRLFQL